MKRLKSSSQKRVLYVALVFFFLVSPIHALGEEASDPLETFNRGVFWFNDKFDLLVFEPLARGYAFVLPAPAKTGASNFFETLSLPKYFVSDLVQLKFTQMATHTGRFLINSTMGIGGLVDVATHWGLERHKEDFGVALGYWGSPAGPYLVVPVWGPTNIRDGIVSIVDGILNPVYWIDYTDATRRTKNVVLITGRATQAISARAGLLEAVETAKESSLDYYLFVRSAYYQQRTALINDGMPAEEEEGFLEDEEFEEDSEPISDASSE